MVRDTLEWAEYSNRSVIYSFGLSLSLLLLLVPTTAIFKLSWNAQVALMIVTFVF